VIQQEQKSLEDQRQALIEEVNMNTISLRALDKQLLDRLSSSTGNLLDDIELIKVLADTKIKAIEVGEKIAASDATQIVISKKREQYRPVATRGSVVYFVITSLTLINCMYQTSLAQFLGWFDGSLRQADKANLVAKRVENLMEHLTFNCYINIDRGLFEVDKTLFKLMVTMKIQLTETPDVLNGNMVTLLLRGGASFDPTLCPKKPFDWLTKAVWVNVCNLADKLEFFADLLPTLEQNEQEFKRWYESEVPEEMDVPRIEERLQNHPSGAMMRLLMIRSFRDDRLRLASQTYIGHVLGKRYVEPIATRMEDIWDVSAKFTPVIMLLTPGADPTAAMQDLAKKKGLKIRAVSMGEGQEKYATRAIEGSMEEGGWALLQNCHLGLGYMNHIDEDLHKAEEEKEVNDEFRLWITCEPHDDFPINLLQMGIKVTNEPPAGMKAGLFRSYTSVVDQERLGRVETKTWRDLVYCTCFLHSVVQERRKFGAIGWCIPYEFNTGDQEASLTFLEKHSFSPTGLNWETIQYMLCEAQYGGRITDDFDRILFKTFGNAWLIPDLFEEGFEFANCHFSYQVPQVETVDELRTFITDFPSHDSPEIFGLHANADLTFGTTEGQYILNTINDTQPKDTSVKAGAKTREEIVCDKCDELLAQMPATRADDIVRDAIRKRSKSENEFVLGFKLEERVDGFTIPLNVFLYQEVVRITFTMKNVKKTLTELKQAINGEVIMTPELQNALDAVSDSKPPETWYKDASGAEIAWTLPTLALWFNGLLDREKQLSSWLTGTRPITYWLTGFFNPQGFLTAARQEVTRRHKAEKWALDDVVIKTDPLNDVDPKRLKSPPAEGVYVHGLFLEGCAWNKQTKMLREAQPKELFCPLPVIHVTAVTSERAKKIYAPSGGISYYDCPCYTKPRRTDLAYVFTVKLATDVNPDHWILRGVSLLCSKD
jgi:dynein heavy chain